MQPAATPPTIQIERQSLPMTTAGLDTSPWKHSVEMVDQRIRNIYHDGFQTSKEMQKVFDKESLPRADQILALPETNRFGERLPNKSVILWTLSKECSPLLPYMIRNGWNLNRGDCTGYRPTLLG